MSCIFLERIFFAYDACFSILPCAAYSSDDVVVDDDDVIAPGDFICKITGIVHLSSAILIAHVYV